MTSLCDPSQKTASHFAADGGDEPVEQVVIDVSHCKYSIVRECAAELGWRISEEETTDFNVFWSDLSASADRVSRLQKYQKLNHFPSMTQICRKVPMIRNLKRMQQLYPEDYDFFPPSWILPFDYSEMMHKYGGLKPSRSLTFIIKPSAGSQGKGIRLAKRVEDINPSECEGSIAQIYLHKPLLIEGFKFDLRVYALVTSCDPLCILLHREGLVRLCTVPYAPPTAKNVDRTCMHLTNFAVNKSSAEFVTNEDSSDGSKGSKRDFAFFNSFVASAGRDPEKLWQDISDIITKSLLAVQPAISHTYRTCQPKQATASTPTPPPDTQASGGGVRGVGSVSSTWVPQRCFEILGFDIMIDQDFRPWLVEVNHSPSFTCGSPLDHRVKHSLITDTFRLLRVSPSDRRLAKSRDVAAAQQRLLSFAPKRGFSVKGTTFGASSSGSGSGSSFSLPRTDEGASVELASLSPLPIDDASSEDLGGFSVIYPTDRTRHFDKLLTQDPKIVSILKKKLQTQLGEGCPTPSTSRQDEVGVSSSVPVDASESPEEDQPS